MNFLFQVIGVGVSLLVSDAILPGVQIDGVMATMFAAIVLIFMNSVVKPVMKILALPITILTLGLFLVVINALTYWWTALLIDGFSIDGFGTAVIGALITSIISNFIQSAK